MTLIPPARYKLLLKHGDLQEQKSYIHVQIHMETMCGAQAHAST